MVWTMELYCLDLEWISHLYGSCITLGNLLAVPLFSHL